MQLNPAQFRLLLVGPRVSRLLPFFEARGFVVDACTTGEQAMGLMQQAPRHVLLMELELEDMLCADLLQLARQKNLAGSVILLEDPSKSGHIVSTLVRGVDGYVATPPDEAYLFRVVERQLLAQWALAQGGSSSTSAKDAAKDAEDKARADRLLAAERAKVTELVREIASLREEVNKAKEASKEASKIASKEVSKKTKPAAATSAATMSDAPTERRPKHIPDDRTSPAGFTPPALDAPANPPANSPVKKAAKPGVPTPGAKFNLTPGPFPAPGSADDGFDEDPLTSPGNPSMPGQERAPAAAKTAPEKKKHLDDGSDLFIELDDSTASAGIDIKKTMDDDDDLLNLDE